SAERDFLAQHAQQRGIDLTGRIGRRRGQRAKQVAEIGDEVERDLVLVAERRGDRVANGRGAGDAALHTEDLAGLDVVDEVADEGRRGFLVLGRSGDRPELAGLAVVAAADARGDTGVVGDRQL